MFEVAEVGQFTPKDVFNAREPGLREALLGVQATLQERGDLAVAVVIGGVDGAGKGEVLWRLLEWMDARGVEVHALDAPTERDRELPRLHRFWLRLPAKGRTGIFLGAWHRHALESHVYDRIDDSHLERELTRVVQFERLLDAEGVLVFKVWLHITSEAQAKRLDKLQSDPDTAWRVTPKDWEHHQRYERFKRSASWVIRRTSTAQSPWHVVEAHDKRFRDLQVAELLLAAIQERLARPPLPRAPKPTVPVPPAIHVISTLDLDQRLERSAYERALPALQQRLGRAARQLSAKGRSAVLVFEGADAAGKGGAIRRLTQALDARYYQVVPIAAPTDEERARPYLWRFWRRLPHHGQITIFDRSWYGRVLVERLEGFARESEWERAYKEINDFEEQLVLAGAVVLKFWLQIGEDEQLRRFEQREATAYKHYKITPEDWRNRGRWSGYEAAAVDMVARTSTEQAPWTLVAANDKLFARIRVLTTVVEALEAAVGTTAEGDRPAASGSPKSGSRKKSKSHKKKKGDRG